MDTKTKNNIIYFLSLGFRICVAVNLISYGYGKLTGEMFDNGYVNMLTSPLNTVDNFHLTWYWFNKNREISIFIGLIQITSAILIVFNRSKLVGVVLAFPILIGTLFVDLFLVGSLSLSFRIVFYIAICLSIIYQDREYVRRIIMQYKPRAFSGRISISSFLYLIAGVVLAFTIELFLVFSANIGHQIFTK